MSDGDNVGRQDEIIENEREWRRYVVAQIEGMRKDIASMREWTLVFRLGGGLFVSIVLTLFYMWIEMRLN